MHDKHQQLRVSIYCRSTFSTIPYTNKIISYDVFLSTFRDEISNELYVKLKNIFEIIKKIYH